MANDQDKTKEFQNQIVGQLSEMFDNLPPERIAAIVAALRAESVAGARRVEAWADATPTHKVEALYQAFIASGAGHVHLVEEKLQMHQSRQEASEAAQKQNEPTESTPENSETVKTPNEAATVLEQYGQVKGAFDPKAAPLAPDPSTPDHEGFSTNPLA